eukprot:scaffold1647_cov23-Cyclotella_meneghiniana.AAC.1
MPSRKKAQGKARKAKQAVEARKIPSQDIDNDASAPCLHISKRIGSDDDYDAAMNLFREHMNRYKELTEIGEENLTIETRSMCNAIYDKYYQLSRAGKDMFRELIVAMGIKCCVINERERDLLKQDYIEGIHHYMLMIQTIEVRDKHNGALDQNIEIEIETSMTIQLCCPRQTVQFYHIRSYCYCLQGIYYKLNEASSSCLQCKNVFDNDVSADVSGTSCHHYSEQSLKCSQDDIDPAHSLMIQYRDKCVGLVRQETYCPTNLCFLASFTYDKYHQFSDVRKDVFRECLLASGTRYCITRSNEIDITQESRIEGIELYVVMILTVEVRDRYNGAYDEKVEREIIASLIDILYCSRQTIKFLHRRNSCDCLQELYYKLKETTHKTSRCHNCKKIFEIKQLSRCEYCNLIQYCSYDCALAHWPEHKVVCEEMGYYKPNRPAKSDDDLEAVD